ncbi:histidine kinase [Anaerocolumna cellulosilytica]|uniref:histidine kinase n=1 Tax=Anaerocolumna cellulosilytica TaxID=433286 RepID=A0A6S6R1K2_9FIRM|nr:sensor histidine kinase [Anaerocolumna cellulosilytica]MBB5196685.1 two-component system sensor histidine kinase YesM [Anaerocolumna cellulosilytica]BCJ93947.1 histidine kinase [Anaerocolumna cellulosilytica]
MGILKFNNYQKVKSVSLSIKLRKIIFIMLLPLIFWILVALIIFGFYENKVAKLTHNVTISSKFNMDFKGAIDLKMYHYTVGSKQQTTLPTSDVKDAIALAESLKRTTDCKESRKALQNILEYCNNLQEKMHMIAETKEYDSRQLQLENNIYVLTRLIQGKMIDYIYYEAGYMAVLEENMRHDIKIVIVLAFLFVCGSISFLLTFGIRFSKSITVPISKLCHNVNQVGQGEFSIPEVNSSYIEIAQLNTGIQHMAMRIGILLENVKEEEKLQHKTQLQLLQAQINPHFLYNTLDAIVWLVESVQQEAAVTMLTNLSVFFRTILSKGNDIISLKEEIMHTKSYLDIQAVRYQDILEYDISLPEELEQIKVPKLTLQPLAENALYHGVKEKRGKSAITIQCYKQEKNIILAVSDNGIGINTDKLRTIKEGLVGSKHDGFGLTAVHERIKLYFGDSFGLKIASAYGTGTTVTVTIPENFQL